MNNSIKLKIQELVNGYFIQVLGYIPSHKIQYKSIGRGIAGTALYDGNVLTFDPFFINQDVERYLSSTVPHEVMHLACNILYPRAKQDHGPEWKGLMKRIGADPKRCHTYSIEGAPKMHARNYIYTCACEREIPLTKRMHTSITEGNHRYCTRCNTNIFLKGIKQ
jgi:SprT protein